MKYILSTPTNFIDESLLQLKVSSLLSTDPDAIFVIPDLENLIELFNNLKKSIKISVEIYHAHWSRSKEFSVITRNIEMIQQSYASQVIIFDDGNSKRNNGLLVLAKTRNIPLEVIPILQIEDSTEKNQDKIYAMFKQKLGEYENAINDLKTAINKQDTVSIATLKTIIKTKINSMEEILDII